MAKDFLLLPKHSSYLILSERSIHPNIKVLKIYNYTHYNQIIETNTKKKAHTHTYTNIARSPWQNVPYFKNIPHLCESKTASKKHSDFSFSHM